MLTDYNYLRIEKAKLMQQQMTEKDIKNSPVSVYTYPIATILPLKKFESDKLAMGRGGSSR